MSDLVIRSFTEGKDLAANLKQSALVPEALRGKEADILFIVLTGAEMGMGPMKSLQAFESIKGRVGMKPVYMLGMVRAHPSIADITLETTATKAVVTSVRKNSPKVLRTEFTMDDAKAAGLTSSEMYRKWPARMLGWRCVAIHCREHHSDITGGHYSSEEVETFERDITPKADVVDAQPAVSALKATIKARRVMAIVDDPPKASPPASPPRIDGDVVLDWPPNRKGKRIETLSEKDCQWCVEAASEAVEKVPEEERALWLDRAAAFTAELMRRGAEKAP